MIVTFLGTGTSQGVPVIGCSCEVCRSVDFRDKRLRVSVHLQVNGKSLIIDSGPDFRQQVLREHITQLDGLLFTHEHKDHTAGMDDIRSFNFRQQKDMPVYASARVIHQLKQEFAYIFSGTDYPGLPKVQLHEIGNQPFLAEGVPVTPIQALHYKLPVFGFRIQDFTYITDANYLSEEEKNKVRGSKVIVLNALHQQKHISHFSLSEAVALLQDLQPKKAYLTHISHQMGTHRSLQPLLPDFIEPAFDGLRLTL